MDKIGQFVKLDKIEKNWTRLDQIEKWDQIDQLDKIEKNGPN